MGRGNFGGVVKRVCLDYVPETIVGDYVIVHVGFALSRIDEVTAQSTLETFRAMGMLDEELETEEEAFARAAQASSSSCPDGSCSDRNCLDGPGPDRSHSSGESTSDAPQLFRSPRHA